MDLSSSSGSSGASTGRRKPIINPEGPPTYIEFSTQPANPLETLVQIKTVSKTHKFNFNWRIDNFAKLYTNCTDYPVIPSPEFACTELPSIKFSMKLYPNGTSEDHKRYVSVFLYPTGMDKADSAGNFLEFSIALIKENKKRDNKRMTSVYKPTGGWGWTKFISHEDLFSVDKNYLVDDTMELRVKAIIHSGYNNEMYNSPDLTPEFEMTQLAKKAKSLLPDDMRKLFFNPKDCDVKIVTKGKGYLYAHKCILAVRSPIFEEMFEKAEERAKENNSSNADVETNADDDNTENTGNNENTENIENIDNTENIENNASEDNIEKAASDENTEKAENDDDDVMEVVEVVEAHKDNSANVVVEAEKVVTEEKEKKIRRKVVKALDFDKDTFQELLRYMYTGRVLNESKFTLELLRGADKYGLDELKILTEHHLAEKFDLESVLRTLTAAEKFNATHLRGQCIKYIIKHPQSVMATHHWKKFSKNPIRAELLATLFKELSNHTRKPTDSKPIVPISKRLRSRQPPATQNSTRESF